MSAPVDERWSDVGSALEPAQEIVLCVWQQDDRPLGQLIFEPHALRWRLRRGRHLTDLPTRSTLLARPRDERPPHKPAPVDQDDPAAAIADLQHYRLARWQWWAQVELAMRDSLPEAANAAVRLVHASARRRAARRAG